MAKIFYFEVDDFLRKSERYKILDNAKNIYGVNWREITPDKNHTWLTEGMQDDWEEMVPMVNKDATNSIFVSNTAGVSTGRDSWAYNSDRKILMENIKKSIEYYNYLVFKLKNDNKKITELSNEFIDETKISWSDSLVSYLRRYQIIKFNDTNIRKSLYRPFYQQYLYYDFYFNERRRLFYQYFPTPETEKENLVICVSAVGYSKTFHLLMVNCIPDLHLTGDSQCFPFYTYNEDGTGRKENITDWALEEFRKRYSDVGRGEKTSPPAPLLKREGSKNSSPLPPGEDLGEGSNTTHSFTEDLGEGKYNKFHYPLPPILLHRAREMRKNPTTAESLLWELLRDRQLNGHKFRRQHVVQNFILDFFSFESRLGIEIDGSYHNSEEKQKYDEIRTRYLGFDGIRILRFTNEEVLNQTEYVLERILLELELKENKIITKWDIFYYIYGVLHSPAYREKYQANLKRSLPRIPFYDDFWKYSEAGKKLAELHVNYESQPEYPLTKIETPGKQLDYNVIKMKLSKDKQSIIYNDFLTLTGIPYETYEYKLGNRSALEWIIDQYQVKTDKRSGIVNDPNRPDEPDYIIKLIGKIITVSLETVKIVREL